MNKENARRTVIGFQDVGILDDFGSYMEVGDTVEIHVMPFDYKVRGELLFCEEECRFFIKFDYGTHSLSHHDEYHDMGSTIQVTKTFKRVRRK